MEMTTEEKEALYAEFIQRFRSEIGSANSNFATHISSNSTFTGSIEQIESARYGAAVREAIKNALETIASECDRQTSGINSQVNNGLIKVNTAISALNLSSKKAADAEDAANRAMSAAQTARTAVDGITNAVFTEPIQYIGHDDGSWEMPDIQFGWDPEYPNGDGGYGAFVFSMPMPPQFKTLSIDRNVENSSISYNPNEGSLSIGIPDIVSGTTFTAEPVSYTNNTVDIVRSIDELTGIPNIHFKIPRGTPGLGADSAYGWLMTRPFIHKLWEPSQLVSQQAQGAVVIPAAKSFFPRSSLIFRNLDSVANYNALHPTETQITKAAYEVADPYDMIMIVFRKSTDNIEGTNQLNAIGTDENKAFDKNNKDYDATTVVWLVKGSRTFAEYRSPNGKLIYRREVRWLTDRDASAGTGTGNLHTYVRMKNTNLSGNTWSYTWLGLETEKDAELDYDAETFDNAVFIGDCFLGAAAEFTTGKARNSGNGALAEYRVGNKGVGFEQGVTQKWYTTNKNYNQYLIPMGIYGFSFRLSQKSITSGIDQAIIDQYEED